MYYENDKISFGLCVYTLFYGVYTESRLNNR